MRATFGSMASVAQNSESKVSTAPAEAQSILRETFGLAEFRGEQAKIINHLIAGGDSIALMPTGGRKIAVLSDTIALPPRGRTGDFSPDRIDEKSGGHLAAAWRSCCGAEFKRVRLGKGQN